MSNLETHLAEHDAITADYEAEASATIIDIGGGWTIDVSRADLAVITNPKGFSIAMPSDTVTQLREALKTPLGSRYPKHLDTVEREIIDLLVRDALAAGYSIEVHGDGIPDLAASTDYADITDMIAACSQTDLIMRHPEKQQLWFLLVHGNYADVISDYTAHPRADEVAKRAMEKAEELQSH